MPPTLTICSRHGEVNCRMFGENAMATMFCRIASRPSECDQRHERGSAALSQRLIDAALNDHADGGRGNDGSRNGENEGHAASGEIPGDIGAEGIDAGMRDMKIPVVV